MADPKDVNAEVQEADKPDETANRLKGDVVSTMSERVKLDKGDETHTKVKKFTLGDDPASGFTIDGLTDKAAGAKLASDKNDGAAEKRASQTVKLENKCELTLDAGENVTSIKSADGKVTRIEYDKVLPPSPDKIKEPDGAEWRREGSAWYQYKNGKVTGEAWNGDIEVKHNGDIVKKTPTGEEAETIHPDGTKTDYPGDNPTITRDTAGRVTEQSYPARDGLKEVDYKLKDGKLTEAHLADGQTWKKTADGKWQQYDGDKQIGTPAAVELKVNSEGDCVVTRAGELVAIKHRDGSQTETKWDGSRETRDKDLRVSEVVYPDGRYTHFNPDKSVVMRNADSQITEIHTGKGTDIKISYDAKGRLSEIHTATVDPETGKEVPTLFKREGDSWTYKMGDKPAVAEHGEIEIGRDGTIIQTYPEDGGELRRRVTYPSSVRREEKHDNSYLTYTSDSKVLAFGYPNGMERRVIYNGNEVEAIDDGTGRTMFRKDNGVWTGYEYDASTRTYTQTTYDDVTVNEDGIRASKRGGGGVTYWSDGSKTKDPP